MRFLGTGERRITVVRSPKSGVNFMSLGEALPGPSTAVLSSHGIVQDHAAAVAVQAG